MPSNRRRMLLVGAAVAALGLAFLALFGRASGTRTPGTGSATAAKPDAAAPPSVAASAQAAAPVPGAVPARPAPSAGSKTRGAIPPGGVARATADEYRRRARYPRSSQPLAQDDEDPVLRERTLSPITMRGPHGEEPAITVMPAQVGFESPEPAVLLAYLSVGDRTVPAREVRGTVVTESQQPVTELEYHDDGLDGDALAGDDVYTAAFNPSTLADTALSASYMVKVRAVTANGEERLAATSFLYSAPHAQLTGSYRDSAAHGDLVVEAEVEVTQAGRFHLEGSLYSADGSARLAWSQAALDLAPGRYWMALPFYGLILNEAHVDGPYLLRYVALSTTTSMPNAMNRLVENAHVTAAYRAASFTDQPFNDPSLLDAADRLEHDAAGALAGLDSGH